MTRKNAIEQLLAEAFSPSLLRVDDDSHKHAGHAGANPEGGSHFTVHIEAEAFAGKSRVARHRMVYDALAGHFAEGLHALAIQAKAPGE